MKIALTGAQGTGKSSVYHALESRRPAYTFFPEAVRHQLPAFGYKSMHELVPVIGIGAFELMNMNAQCVVDPKVNHLLDPAQTIIMDRCALDCYGYFLARKMSEIDERVDDLLHHMARHYLSDIDLFLYFPVGKIPLIQEGMRNGDPAVQRKLDASIQEAFKIFAVGKERIHTMETIALDDRVEEALEVIDRLEARQAQHEVIRFSVAR